MEPMTTRLGTYIKCAETSDNRCISLILGAILVFSIDVGFCEGYRLGCVSISLHIQVDYYQGVHGSSLEVMEISRSLLTSQIHQSW